MAKQKPDVPAKRPRGRPRKGEEIAPPTSTHIRIKLDLNEKVKDLCWYFDQPSADVLDRFIRGPIEAAWNEYKPLIDALKKARLEQEAYSAKKLAQGS